MPQVKHTWLWCGVALGRSSLSKPYPQYMPAKHETAKSLERLRRLEKKITEVFFSSIL